MKTMEKLGKTVSRAPMAVITVTIVLTIILGYFASTIEMTTDWKEYLPDNDVVNAYFEVAEEYGEVEGVQILVKANNGDVLTMDVMLEILEVERALLNDTEVLEALKTPDVPGASLISCADFIAQTAFLNVLQTSMPENQGIDMNLLTNLLMSLSMDQKITIFTGGDIFVEAVNMSLHFEEQNDSSIKGTLHWFLTNRSAPADQRAVLLTLLSNDLDTTSPDPSAKAANIIFMLNATTRDGEGDQEMMDRLGEVEVHMLEIIDLQELHHSETSIIAMGVINKEIKKTNEQTMNELIPISLILVILVLFITFRNFSDTVFGMFGLGISVVWMFGLGQLIGVSFNEMILTTPILVFGLGIDYAIHVVMRYREEIRLGMNVKEAVSRTVTFIGIALLLATITTVVGFLSNLSSPVRLIGQFGVLVALGIISSFVVMTTFVPACRQIVDEWKVKQGKPVLGGSGNAKNNVNNNAKNNEKIEKNTINGGGKASGIDTLNRTLAYGAIGAEHHPHTVILIVLIITGITGYGAMNLETEFSQSDFMPSDTDIADAIEYLDNNFNGSMTDYAIILVKGNISNPDVLKAINDTAANMGNDNEVVAVDGRAHTEHILLLIQKYAFDTVKIGNETLSTYPDFADNFSRADTDKDGIPDKNVSYFYDWLYLNDPGAGFLIHRNEAGEYDGTVLKVYVDVESESEQGDLYSDIKDDKKPLDKLKSSGILDKVVVSGIPILMYTTTTSLQTSQMRSIFVTIIASFIVLTLIFYYTHRSLTLGIITIVPVVLVLIWVYGIMFFLGMKMNAMTAIIGSLTIGLGITYAIHVTQRFVEDASKIEDIDEACRVTVRHTGTALVGAGVTTIAAFGTLMLSTMPPARQFGGIVSITIFLSFVTSVFVLPTLLVMWAKWKKGKGSLHREDSLAQQKSEPGKPDTNNTIPD